MHFLRHQNSAKFTFPTPSCIVVEATKLTKPGEGRDLPKQVAGHSETEG